MKPWITVVIPNLNSPLIDQTLAALHCQTFDLRRVEVLVVGLDEPGLVNSDDLVRLLSTGEATSAAHNRNLGMRSARGEIVCFTDADCIPTPDWLTRLTAPYSSRDIDVVGGSVHFEWNHYWSVCDNLSWFYQFLSSGSDGERTFLPSLNLSVRRQVIEQVGGMDENYLFDEDVEWTQRMRTQGYSLCFEPRAVVTHIARRTSMRTVLQHGYNYGRFSPKIDVPLPGSPISDRLALLYSKWWWLFYLLSPFLTIVGVWRVIRTIQSPTLLFYIPGICLSKFAWCMGAAQTLRTRKTAMGAKR